MNTNADLLNSLKIDRNAPKRGGRKPDDRRKWWIIAGVAAVLVLTAIAYAVFGNRVTAVQTLEVEAAQGSGGAAATPGAVLDASGYIVARRIATVSSQVTGRVSKVLIEEGQQVTAGQVMATLDPIDANAQQELASAQVNAAAAQAGAIEAQLRDATANAARLSTLAGQQLVSRAQADQAIAQRDALRAQLNAIRRNTNVASAQLRIANRGVDHTVVRAPFSGVVIAKAAQPGEIVSPLSAGGGYTRTGIGTIVDMDSLEVEVEVGENFIGRVREGMPTETILNAYPDWKIPGHVIAVIPTADRGKATIKVRVSLDSRDTRVVPDMGARVSFFERAAPAGQPQAKPSVLVPQSAIVKRGSQSVAFVLTDGKANQTSVSTGRTIGDDIEVTAGLKAGDELILQPPETLKDGQRVQKSPDPKEPEEQ
ncbi:efflux RND transporter periplasmic adaptor subunit [Luteimonas sp. FXH3W]|uniref:Efflux RND transporter periplasmic adaptor subunit n=1 Tax=Aquilutibacter rugosus TaxID=3115820 RepID=A0ABU7UXP2_9GAMM